MARALIPLANGFEEIEALSVVDILRRGGVEVVTASIHGDVAVRAAHGVTVLADALFEDVADETFDAIVLPGGGEGTENLKAFVPLFERLHRQKADGGLICAICAAPTVLVAAGVLEDGQHITCYPTCQMELDRPWINQPVVVHDNVITGQGPGTSTLFGLVILQTLTDEKTAAKIARGMVTDVL